MRHLALFIAFLIAGAASFPVCAADAIETSSVIIPLADEWRERGGGEPIAALGPNGERMELTVIRSGSSGSLDAAESGAISTLRSTATSMKIVMPLKSFSLPNGTRVNELVCQSNDGGHILLGVVLRGASSIVLATIEGPSVSGAALSKARSRLLSLRWK